MTQIPFKDAAIFWEPLSSGEPFSGEMHVIDANTPRQMKYDKLACSGGACFREWRHSTAPVAEILRAMVWLLEDGINPATIHREFMKIDAYADAIGDFPYFGVEVDEFAA